MNKLEALLHLQDRVQSVETLTEFGFICVNETRLLSSYRQAILWDHRQKVQSISGTATIEKNSAYFHWLESLINRLALQKNIGPVILADLSEQDQEQWHEWLPAYALWVPFSWGGGLLLVHDQVWEDRDIEAMTRLAKTYDYAYRSLHGPIAHKFSLWHFLRKRPVKLALAATVGALGFIQVPLTVLAPVEIVAVNPDVMRSSYDGVVAHVHVAPNEAVSQGQLLFELDDTALVSELEVTRQEVTTLQVQYEQERQKALFDPKATSKIALIEGDIEAKKAHLEYLTLLLKRLKIYARQDGITVFSSVNEWVGRPVSIGERVMMVADEYDTMVEAWMSVGDALDLPQGAALRVFLNADPLNPFDAKLKYIAYQAQPQPDGALAYRVRADIVQNAIKPRLGLKGTARIKADDVSIYYWMFRRPIAVIRQLFGV